jgi:hypothetical protein
MSSFDLDTQACVQTTVIKDVVFSGSGPLAITAGRLQFGTNHYSYPHQIRLWTHTPTLLHNDLMDLSMEDLTAQFAGRSTRNIEAPSICIEDFVRHEISPHVKVVNMAKDNLPELVIALRASLGDPLGVSSNGNQYVHRTEIVVIHQTAVHFITGPQMEELLANDAVFLLLIAAEGSALRANTLKCVQPGRKISVPRYVSGKVSLVDTLDGFRTHLPEQFESCQAPKENLRLVVAGGNFPCFRVRKDDTQFLGMTAEKLKPIAESAGLFAPFDVFVFGSAALSYTYSSGLSLYHGAFAEDSPAEIKLAQYFIKYPNLELAVAIVLQAEARRLLPTPEQLQILVPMFTLIKHAQHLEKGNPAIYTLTAAADVLKQEFIREKPDFFAEVEAQVEVLRRVSKHFQSANSRSLNKLTLDVLNRFRLGEDVAESDSAVSCFKSPFVLPPPLPARVLNMLYSTSPLINILPPSFGVFGADLTTFGAAPPMRQFSQQASYTTL